VPLDDIEVVTKRGGPPRRSWLLEDPPQRFGADLNRHIGELVEQLGIRRGPLGFGAAALRSELRQRANEPAFLPDEPHHHDVVVLHTLESEHRPIRAVWEEA
jgi:hypothetical protein